VLDDLDPRRAPQQAGDPRPVHRRRQPDQAADAGPRARQLKSGVAQRGQEPLDLLRAAAGKQPENDRVRVKTEPPAGRRARGRAAQAVDEGVADEVDGHPGRAVERDLERKYGEHPRDEPRATPRSGGG